MYVCGLTIKGASGAVLETREQRVSRSFLICLELMSQAEVTRLVRA